MKPFGEVLKSFHAKKGAITTNAIKVGVCGAVLAGLAGGPAARAQDIPLVPPISLRAGAVSTGKGAFALGADVGLPSLRVAPLLTTRVDAEYWNDLSVFSGNTDGLAITLNLVSTPRLPRSAYFGGGIGWNRLRLNGEDKNGFAWKLLAGVSVSDRVALEGNLNFLTGRSPGIGVIARFRLN